MILGSMESPALLCCLKIGYNIIKPFMMGIGAPAPMLIVFIGTIGGFIMRGFIGLFTGAIVLTLGYKLVIEWLNQENETENEPDSPDSLQDQLIE